VKAATDSEIYAMELRVLQPAQRALARKDYASALASVAEHQRRFPSGRLAEEREALRVKALLGLGRDTEAKRAGTAFRTRFPQSALGGRMDEMLEAEK
jgi:outer membrane protein assembly factor BamD (BamD/ComL family)